MVADEDELTLRMVTAMLETRVRSGTARDGREALGSLQRQVASRGKHMTRRIEGMD